MPSRGSADGSGRRGRTRGSTSLEFALVGGMLLLLLLGGIETSRYLFMSVALRMAAADAARMAAVTGGANLAAGRAACAGLSGPLPGAQARVPVLDAASLSVVLSGCASTGAITTVTVTARYPFRFAVPLSGSRDRIITEVTRGIFY